jgi:hypothetical protein
LLLRLLLLLLTGVGIEGSLLMLKMGRKIAMLLLSSS